MGRHKLIKTDAEIAAQKKRWAIRRNRKRRENYKRDTSYRSRVNARNRESYRRRSHGDQWTETLRDCSANLLALASFGKERKVRLVVDGRPEVRLEMCFTIGEMAELLGGYHPIVLYRWHREGKFPKPKRTVAEGLDKGQRVYLLSQAKRLVKIMSDHQKQKFYLNAGDKETIKALFAAMKEQKPNGNGADAVSGENPTSGTHQQDNGA